MAEFSWKVSLCLFGVQSLLTCLLFNRQDVVFEFPDCDLNSTEWALSAVKFLYVFVPTPLSTVTASQIEADC